MEHVAVAEALRELGRLLEATGEATFRVRAYERAGNSLDALSERDLERRVEEHRLEELPYIGKGLARKIELLYRDGSLPELEALRRKVPRGFRELSRLEGLGPKKILVLHQALGIQDLVDLERAIDEEQIRTVKGFTAATEKRLKPQIEAARARRDRFLWLAATREADRLIPRLERAGAESVTVAGEARRAQEQVDALDLVVRASEPEQVADAFAAMPGLLGPTRPSPSRVVTTSPDGLHVEVRFARPSDHPAALVWETGPAAHCRELAARAGARGLALSGDGLRDAGGRPVPLVDEADLYARLGLPWIPAELRDDPEAIAQADAGETFDDLVRVADVIGMVHCHSTFSDGRNTIEELARACDAQGVAYLTLTDHSPSASYAGGVTPDALLRQWDEIDRVQEQVRVVLLKGTESDILGDGSLDYPDAVLERLDVVIASVHQRHRLDPPAMTERVIRAMRHPLYKIWGHALGRLIGRRDPIGCDVEAILDAVAESRAAIEINSDPHRLDLPPEWIRRARARGIPFVVSVDAHSVSGLSLVPFGVGIARRAGVRRGEVLNTRPVGEFRAAVRPVPQLRDPRQA